MARTERIEFRVTPKERRAYDVLRHVYDGFDVPMGQWIRSILNRHVNIEKLAAERRLDSEEFADYLESFEIVTED